MDMRKLASASAKGKKQPTAVSRMQQDYMRLKKDPLPYISAEPLPSNILEWHYVVKGPEGTAYEGGYYHGTLMFPREFPFRPPAIYMITPNGRFRTNTRLCLSISDFHPDTWNPTWCVGTILTGLLSFMLESTSTLGSIESTTYEKQQYAKKSLAFNLKNPNFRELFPDICEEINKRLQSQEQIRKLTENSNDNNNIINDTIETDTLIGTVESKSTKNVKSSVHSFINWQAIYSNLIIVISFAIFALVVNYVLKNLNQE